MTATTRIARVFDGATDGVPYYAPDHPRLNPADRTQPLAYLAAGTPLLMTTASEPDFVEPARGEVVPMGFRTDGTWVWNDALTYYLSEYGFAPEPEFLAAMEAAGWQCPTPPEDVLERAMEELFED
ncbi:hypothetical protein [Catenulispora pinisilvae]|uniref:hypothetical protein n=1 Tax=Catenulispora pinisilvae TaxID=2705253 RepID=UPI00189188D2|nr:hypothetical protein [Catenulispora pinisilvae]